MEWVSVKDRLPEEGQRVLVYGHHCGKKYTYCTFREGGFLEVSSGLILGLNDHCEPTHWMEMLPPKED